MDGEMPTSSLSRRDHRNARDRGAPAHKAIVSKESALSVALAVVSKLKGALQRIFRWAADAVRVHDQLEYGDADRAEDSAECTGAGGQVNK